jgi:hypothetical protein
MDHGGQQRGDYVMGSGGTVNKLTKPAKGRARILAARCRHLEEIGKPVNKKTMVLTWGEKVKQAASERMGR